MKEKLKRLFKTILIFAGIFTVIIVTFNILGIYDDKDACLDIGVCKEGLSLIIDGQEIIINQQSCTEHNGEWREKYNDCLLK